MLITGSVTIRTASEESYCLISFIFVVIEHLGVLVTGASQSFNLTQSSSPEIVAERWRHPADRQQPGAEYAQGSGWRAYPAGIRFRISLSRLRRTACRICLHKAVPPVRPIDPAGSDPGRPRSHR